MWSDLGLLLGATLVLVGCAAQTSVQAARPTRVPVVEATWGVAASETTDAGPAFGLAAPRSELEQLDAQLDRADLIASTSQAGGRTTSQAGGRTIVVTLANRGPNPATDIALTIEPELDGLSISSVDKAGLIIDGLIAELFARDEIDLALVADQSFCGASLTFTHRGSDPTPSDSVVKIDC